MNIAFEKVRNNVAVMEEENVMCECAEQQPMLEVNDAETPKKEIVYSQAVQSFMENEAILDQYLLEAEDAVEKILEATRHHMVAVAEAYRTTVSHFTEDRFYYTKDILCNSPEDVKKVQEVAERIEQKLARMEVFAKILTTEANFTSGNYRKFTKRVAYTKGNK